MHASHYARLLKWVEGKRMSDEDKDFNKSEKKKLIENALVELIIKERLPLQKLDSKYMNNLIDGKYIGYSEILQFFLFVLIHQIQAKSNFFLFE